MAGLTKAILKMPEYTLGMTGPGADFASVGATAVDGLNTAATASIAVDDTGEMICLKLIGSDVRDNVGMTGETVLRRLSKLANVAGDMGGASFDGTSMIAPYAPPTQLGVVAVKGLGVAGAVLSTALDTKQWFLLAVEVNETYQKREQATGHFEREFYDAQFKTACTRFALTTAVCLVDGVEIATSWVPVLGLAANLSSAAISVIRIGGEKHAFNIQKRKMKQLVYEYQTVPSVPKGKEYTPSPAEQYDALKKHHEEVREQYLEMRKTYMEAREAQHTRQKDLRELSTIQITDDLVNNDALKVLEESSKELDRQLQVLKGEFDKLEELDKEFSEKFAAAKKEHGIIEAARKRNMDLDPLQQKVEALKKVKDAYEKEHPEILTENRFLNKKAVDKLREKFKSLKSKGRGMYWDAFRADPRNVRSDDIRTIFRGCTKVHYNKRDKNTHIYRDAYLAHASAQNALKRLDAYLEACEELDKVQEKQNKTTLSELSRKAPKKPASTGIDKEPTHVVLHTAPVTPKIKVPSPSPMIGTPVPVDPVDFTESTGRMNPYFGETWPEVEVVEE